MKRILPTKIQRGIGMLTIMMMSTPFCSSQTMTSRLANQKETCIELQELSTKPLSVSKKIVSDSKTCMKLFNDEGTWRGGIDAIDNAAGKQLTRCSYFPPKLLRRYIGCRMSAIHTIFTTSYDGNMVLFACTDIKSIETSKLASVTIPYDKISGEAATNNILEKSVYFDNDFEITSEIAEQGLYLGYSCTLSSDASKYYNNTMGYIVGFTNGSVYLGDSNITVIGQGDNAQVTDKSNYIWTNDNTRVGGYMVMGYVSGSNSLHEADVELNIVPDQNSGSYELKITNWGYDNVKSVKLFYTLGTTTFTDDVVILNSDYKLHFGETYDTWAEDYRITSWNVSPAKVSVVSVTVEDADGNTKTLYDDYITDNEYNAEESGEVTPTPSEDFISGTYRGHGYVDLGLPSGTLWASCNVGANSSTEKGTLYRWGELEVTDSYSYMSGSWMAASYQDLGTEISGNPQYDVAAALWGGSWRLPTYSEAKELFDNCSQEYITINGTKAFKITAANGNYIYLPMTSVSYDVPFCKYWTGTQYDASVDQYRDNSEAHSMWNNGGGETISVTTQRRYDQEGVRAVYSVPVYVTSISLSEKDVTLLEKETYTLTATLAPDNATDKSITWTSSNREVVSIADGVLTAQAIGDAVVYATASNGLTDSCKVTVKKNPALMKVELSNHIVGLTVGESMNISAESYGDIVTWTVPTNSEYVISYNNGVINAKKCGLAVIIASVSATVQDTCIVVVLPNTDSVDLGLESGTLWATRNVGAEHWYDAGSYYNYEGTADNFEPLNYCTESDNIGGSNWRFPSKDELLEMYLNTNSYLLTFDNVNATGILTYSSDYSACIFLPYTGLQNAKGQSYSNYANSIFIPTGTMAQDSSGNYGYLALCCEPSNNWYSTLYIMGSDYYFPVRPVLITDSTEVAITTTLQAEQDVDQYDLLGRRIQHLSKGITIRNGRKVIK